MSTTDAPDVSVVVPTRDRPRQLGECLTALERQTFGDFEIVVVDDASIDAAAVARAVAAAPRARLLRGSGAGPAAARNAGVEVARGRVCCLLDDDCRPEADWLRAIVERIDDGAVVVAGVTRNGEPDNPCAIASQTVIDHLAEWSYDLDTDTIGFVPTCNVAALTSTMLRFPFDERYPFAAGEDRAWCTRLAAAGVPIVREAGAVVAHHQQLTLAGFWRQQLRYGRGAHRWQRDRPRGERLQRPSFYVGLVRRGAARGARAGALVVLAQVATAAGVAVEWLAGRSASNRRRPRS